MDRPVHFFCFIFLKPKFSISIKHSGKGTRLTQTGLLVCAFLFFSILIITKLHHFGFVL